MLLQHAIAVRLREGKWAMGCRCYNHGGGVLPSPLFPTTALAARHETVVQSISHQALAPGSLSEGASAISLLHFSAWKFGS